MKTAPKQPERSTFQMRIDDQFTSDINRVIKLQSDNPTQAEMIRRLVRHAVTSKLKLPSTEDNS